VTVGDGEALGALEAAVAAEVLDAGAEELDEVVPEVLDELEDELPQPASSTRAPARAQALEKRVFDMSRTLVRIGHRSLPKRLPKQQRVSRAETGQGPGEPIRQFGPGMPRPRRALQLS
jgi:hypothetical protein